MSVTLLSNGNNKLQSAFIVLQGWHHAVGYTIPICSLHYTLIRSISCQVFHFLAAADRIFSLYIHYFWLSPPYVSTWAITYWMYLPLFLLIVGSAKAVVSVIVRSEVAHVRLPLPRVISDKCSQLHVTGLQSIQYYKRQRQPLHQPKVLKSSDGYRSSRACGTTSAKERALTRKLVLHLVGRFATHRISPASFHFSSDLGARWRSSGEAVLWGLGQGDPPKMRFGVGGWSGACRSEDGWICCVGLQLGIWGWVLVGAGGSNYHKWWSREGAGLYIRGCGCPKKWLGLWGRLEVV